MYGFSVSFGFFGIAGIFRTASRAIDGRPQSQIRSGDGKQEADQRDRRACDTQRLFWNHAWKLIRLNLLFLACCIPVVTMPAALCAMDRALIVLVREGNVLLWEEFRDEFKKDFWRSLPLGLLFGGLLFLGYFLLSLGMGNFGTFLGPMFFAFGLFAIGLALGRGSYAFLMRAMFDLPNGQILKNANGMSALRGGRGWLPIVVHGVGFLFGFSFFPYTLIVIALFGISLPQYLICYLLNDPIQKNIISPWERMQAQKET